MCYMESKMQEQYDEINEIDKALLEEFQRFTEWFLSIPDVDETLIDIKYLNGSAYLDSPSETANSLWCGWRARAFN